MEPKIWGPHAWQFLHSITLSYPDNPTIEDKNNYAQFFNSIQNILPCQNCKDHYTQNLQEFPVEQHLDNKESLFRWLVDIHNLVNVKNNKREYSYDEVTELYEKMYDKSKNSTNSKLISNKWLFILFIVLLIILVIYYIRFNK